MQSIRENKEELRNNLVHEWESYNFVDLQKALIVHFKYQFSHNRISWPAILMIIKGNVMT